MLMVILANDYIIEIRRNDIYEKKLFNNVFAVSGVCS